MIQEWIEARGVSWEEAKKNVFPLVRVSFCVLCSLLLHIFPILEELLIIIGNVFVRLVITKSEFVDKLYVF